MLHVAEYAPEQQLQAMRPSMLAVAEGVWHAAAAGQVGRCPHPRPRAHMLW